MSNSVDVKEVDGWWECSVCRRQFEAWKLRTVHIIDGQAICEECYNRGQIWAIMQAWKEICHKNLT